MIKIHYAKLEYETKPIIKYLRDYLDYLEIEKGLSPKSQENYARFLNRFFKWLNDNNLSELEPQDLDSNHIWRYRLHLSRHIDPQTKSFKNQLKIII